MPWPSGSRTPGKSFKLGFEFEPESKLFCFVHHCFPLHTIFYARDLMISSLHEGARRVGIRPHAHDMTRDGMECDQSFLGSTYIHTWLGLSTVKGFAPMSKAGGRPTCNQAGAIPQAGESGKAGVSHPRLEPELATELGSSPCG